MTIKHVGAAIAALRKKYGKDSAGTLSAGGKSTVTEVISSGVDVIDRYVLGCGGWPVGRISEVYSEEGGGKTSLMYAALASVQREGGIAVLAETEQGLNAERAAEFGVNVEDLLLLEPATVEKCGGMIEDTLAALKGSGVPIFIGWDSLAATETDEEYEKGASERDQMGARGKASGRMMRALAPLISKSRAHFMVINQTREKMGVAFGDKSTTPGGKAVKFAASNRVQLLGGKAVKRGDEHIGKIITVMGTKNRFAPPWRKARVRLLYSGVWDNDWSTMEHAKTAGLMAREEADFYAQDPEGFMAEIKRRLDRQDWALSVDKPDAPDDESGPSESDEGEDF